MPRLADLQLVAVVAIATCSCLAAASELGAQASASARLRLQSLPPKGRTAVASLDACFQAEPGLRCVWTLMTDGEVRSLSCHSDAALSCRSKFTDAEPGSAVSASCSGCPACLKLFDDISGGGSGGSSGDGLTVGCLCSCARVGEGPAAAAAAGNLSYPCGSDPEGVCDIAQQPERQPAASSQQSYLLVGPLAGLVVMAAIGFAVLRRDHICRSTDTPRISGQIEFAFSAGDQQQQPRQSVSSRSVGRRESCTKCGAVRVEVTEPDAADGERRDLMELADSSIAGPSESPLCGDGRKREADEDRE